MKNGIRILPVPQVGAALAVSLIFLLVLTILSLAAMSGSGLQERMAGGIRESNIAFQAAESALLAGEAWIGGPLQGRPVPITHCRPACAAPQVWGTRVTISTRTIELDPLAYPWNEFDWRNAQELGDSSVQLPLVVADPRYVVQQSAFKPDSFTWGTGEGTFYYTVTAQGLGRGDQYPVILQSVYTRRF